MARNWLNNFFDKQNCGELPERFNDIEIDISPKYIEAFKTFRKDILSKIEQ